MSQKIHLGEEVRDVISGFKGIVTGRAEYLTGCTQILVTANSKDNKRENEWFDEARLEALKPAQTTLLQRFKSAVLSGHPGGPQANPAPSRAPRN